jgi:hypothetical protein
MRFLLLLLAAQAAPDDVSRRARALIRDLESDAVEERERALEGLVALGAAAVPFLEQAKAGRGPDDVRRIEAALREIGREGRIVALRPPVRRRTFEIEGTTRAELAARAMAAFDVEVTVRPDPGEAPAPARLAVRDATVWETLDALDSRLGLRPALDPFFSEGYVRPELSGGRPADPVRWTTLGDLRLFVRPGILKTATGESCPYFEFAVALPPQTFALDILLDGLTSDGKPLCLSSQPRRMRAGDVPPVRRPGRFSVGDTRVTSLDDRLLQGRDRVPLRGNLVLVYPRDLERCEFGEKARDGPVVRRSGGVTLTYGLSRLSEPEADTFLGWTHETQERETFLVCLEKDGRWERDVRLLTTEPGTGCVFWNSERRLITLLRLVGAEKLTLPFEIRDVPVPQR